MTTLPQTRLASVLARPEFTTSLDALAAAFVDQTVLFRLEDCAPFASEDIGAHLRRSFLAAFSSGASEAAQAGMPCSWDPPCALDVFWREQLRGPRGDGLPKPYVMQCYSEGPDLIVAVRVFGMALDWFMVASEAMAQGLRTILPWGRILRGRTGVPRITDRWVEVGCPAPMPAHDGALRLVFSSKTDVGKTDPSEAPHRLLSRLLRRVDGISRWNGLAITDGVGRAMAQHMAGLQYDTSGLSLVRYTNPNGKKQSRVNHAVTGHLTIRGDWVPIWPVLAMGERCHLGRGAVEGLGKFGVVTG